MLFKLGPRLITTRLELERASERASKHQACETDANDRQQEIDDVQSQQQQQ